MLLKFDRGERQNFIDQVRQIQCQRSLSAWPMCQGFRTFDFLLLIHLKSFYK